RGAVGRDGRGVARRRGRPRRRGHAVGPDRRMSGSAVGVAVWRHRAARRDPDAPFLQWHGATLTYGRADARVREVAAALRRLDADGAGTGRVAIFAGNCPAAVLTWLAAQAAGLVPVTLNRGQRGRVLADVTVRSRPSVILADPEGASILREALAEHAPQPLEAEVVLL